MKIEILYFKDCPSYKKAYELVEQIINENNVDAKIEFVLITKDMDAEKLKFRGSPTILIDGKDIDSGTKESFGFGCRLYDTKKGLQPYPTKEMIQKTVDSAYKRGE